jgi:hypothetical protein
LTLISYPGAPVETVDNSVDNSSPLFPIDSFFENFKKNFARPYQIQRKNLKGVLTNPAKILKKY